FSFSAEILAPSCVKSGALFAGSCFGDCWFPGALSFCSGGICFSSGCYLSTMQLLENEWHRPFQTSWCQRSQNWKTYFDARFVEVNLNLADEHLVGLARNRVYVNEAVCHLRPIGLV
ncbi:MAG: hypothetical protein ACRDF4_08745, partial [Rhabdochlamydiaceae bacterium]